MPYTAIVSTDVDAKSPITDDLMGDLAANDAYLKSVLTDGASAPQAISTSSLTTSGNATINGTLTVGAFFSSEQILFLYW
jgi:hypothetical protein